MKNRHALAAAVCALAAACSSAPAATQVRAEPADPLGRTTFYVRSNQDGGMRERIIVHRESRTRLAVSKQVERCTNAAYVTADLDLSRNEMARVTGGRLRRDLVQEPIATIAADLNDRTLQVDVPQANLHETLRGVGAPWRLYDFDLADISALMEGKPAPRENWAFFVALAWADDANPGVFNRGRADARFIGAEERLGHATIRYDVSGALNGSLWLDERDGYVVEARFHEPNHPGYENYALTLERVAEGSEGPQAWRDALAAHWQGCP
jgi:hypothetical protein